MHLHSGMFSKVLFRCENIGRQDDFANFLTFSHMISVFFSTQLTLFRPKNSIGLKKDSIHVRKCQKFAKSSYRPMFSQQNKTLGNIPLCTGGHRKIELKTYLYDLRESLSTWAFM